ncbi:acyl--CoA ligase [Azospirillum sp. RWY-5-1]|uniref:Acyl--CoA ligase n=1 Tax=Azospirillum oleiclasticum TaxID=2735135 RepID=A0ABX2T694_9PROT|nr:class I adenylate-forming enzyme family protein [Azospirillum oleiclasticum]NYZ11308.1 acyl--CoA ligase [Azospirillum oleiclasticum]NYZ18469.1 acyl--CoA ligase [Azospirillum oleiclasticum]
MSDTPPDLLLLTVPQLLERRAAETPHRIALSAQSRGGWRDRLSYAQLVERMNAMARGFARLDLREGDRIGVLLTNDAGRECILTALGALRLGAAVAPLNTRSSDEELGHALALVEPAAVVTTTASAARIAALWPAARLFLVDAGTDAPAGAVRWPEPVEEAAGAPPPVADDPDRLTCLLFTSGTTARSKAVMHTHRTMIGAGLCCGTALGLGPGDLYQGGWPFFTSSGLNLGCMASWTTGAGLVFEGVLDNAGRLRLIAAERSTFYHGVPSVVHFMIEEYARGQYDVASLRRVGYGGSAMPAEVIQRLGERWPRVEPVQIYGMTESGPAGTVLPPEDRWRKYGSIGVPMPWCAVSILDEAGFALGPGETGEIAIHGPGVSPGYFRNPEATAAAFVGGAIRTGDVGHLDEDGYLFFTDRRKDIINRGGLKIASVAVEHVLYQHPAVREAAVVAVPHRDLGEDVAACIVPPPGVSPDLSDIAAFCAGRLADYERPRRWLVLDELPKNPMGKVLKTELRALLERGAG